MATINYTPGQILYIRLGYGISYLSICTGTSSHDKDTMIHTCCDFTIHEYGETMYKGDTIFAREKGSMLNVATNFEEIRLAEDFEKKMLFDALVRDFKEYDSKWASHFTDSSYFDILDWLAWEFNVDLDDEANQNTSLGETISEIQNYIWNVLCKEIGNYQACTDYVEPKMVNKQEFIEKAKKWVRNFLIGNLADGVIDRIVRDFEKYMEE